MKTGALVTAAALLFGVVSGGTMFGVNRAAELLFPAETQAQTSTGASLEQVQVVPASPQMSSDAASGVVIEDVSPIVDAVMPSVVAITNTRGNPRCRPCDGYPICICRFDCQKYSVRTWNYDTKSATDESGSAQNI